MPDVFLSYAREDRTKARAIADALQNHGWTVWLDMHATPGKAFDEEIEEQLAQSRCVLVLWSAHSITSSWVKNEATVAAERGVLVPVLLEPVRIPLAFRHLHASDLGEASRIEESPGWNSVVARIAAIAPAVVEKSLDADAALQATSAALGVLEGVNGKLAGRRWPIPVGETISIGRAPRSDGLAIDDETVSRRHAEIIVSNDGAVLKDLGSTAGTFVNEVLITSCLLRDEDLIRIGAASTLRFCLASRPAAPTVVAIAGSTGVDRRQPRTVCDPALGLHMVAVASGPDPGAATLACDATLSFFQTTLDNADGFTWPAPVDPSRPYQSNRLFAALFVAHHRLRRESYEGASFVDAVAATIDASALYVAGLGEPQCYLFRRTDSTTLLFDARRGGPALTNRESVGGVFGIRTDRPFGDDISSLRVKDGRIGAGDVVLLTSRDVTALAVAAAKRSTLGRNESVDALSSAVSDLGNEMGVEPFSFVIISLH